ncbi:FAD-dependent oxidoreductase [Bacillus sp. BGMRC 2118]|nr:FAD-dependent oxidoreductase [Bacillus sp. BGMRC 2118]
MSNSVCIIGAGIGGLTAGAYLANAGFDVTIVEKATTVGGSAGWYVRKGRRFPTGATIAFGLEDEGILRKMLNELKIKLPADELLHPMDVILRDRKVSIYKDAKQWETELSQSFPENKEAVIKFWNELHKVSKSVLEVTNSGVSLPIRRVYDLGKLPRYMFQNPASILRLVRYATWTVEDFMRKFDLDSYEPLKELLNAQLLDAVQIDVSKAAFLPSCVALSIYRNGSFSLEGGLGQLCMALADKIEELGGKVLLGSPIQRIQYDEQKKEWRVESKKCSESFSYLINNSGISFGRGTSYAETGEFSWGAFRVDAILSVGIKHVTLKNQTLPFAYQIVPKQMNEEHSTHGPIYVTFHDTKDTHGKAVSQEVTMTISVHTDADIWDSYSKEEYKLAKEQLMNFIIDEVERIIPVKKYLLYTEAGSPRTYQKFIGKKGVGGFPLTVKNAILNPKGVRSRLPRFYIVGEQVFPGPGTLSSSLSGYYAARAIIKE